MNPKTQQLIEGLEREKGSSPPQLFFTGAQALREAPQGSPARDVVDRRHALLEDELPPRGEGLALEDGIVFEQHERAEVSEGHEERKAVLPEGLQVAAGQESLGILRRTLAQAKRFRALLAHALGKLGRVAGHEDLGESPAHEPVVDIRPP